jgi:hypothetical protein
MNKPDIREGSRPPNEYKWFAPVHFYVWIGAATIFYSSEALDRVAGLWLLVVPLVVIPFFIALTTFVCGLLGNIRARRWKRLLSVVTAPLLASGLLAAVGHYGLDPDWLRFQLKREHYLELAHDSHVTSPKHLEWSWGDTGGATVVNIFYTLIYDESDKPLERFSHKKTESAKYSVTSYGDHFFLVTELYE